MADPRKPFDTGLLASDIDPERPRPLDTPWGSMSIFSLGDRLLAVQSFCPHLMGPLFQGTVAGDTVTCPWHQWCFSLRTGRRMDPSGEPMAGGARLFTAEVRTSPRGTILLVPSDLGDVVRP